MSGANRRTQQRKRKVMERDTSNGKCRLAFVRADDVVGARGPRADGDGPAAIRDRLVAAQLDAVPAGAQGQDLRLGHAPARLAVHVEVGPAQRDELEGAVRADTGPAHQNRMGLDQRLEYKLTHRLRL